VLRAELTLQNGVEVVVFVAHLKSKRPIVDDALRHDQQAKAVGHAASVILRAAEAAAFRCILVREMLSNTKPVIVIGDLNDSVRSLDVGTGRR
jgi:predicted extracellular nuclease